jgi:Zn-dependent membrane protease YugP
MLFFDPRYLLFVAPGFLLAMWASYRVRQAYGRYSQVPTQRGLSGAEAAVRLLEYAGIHDVRVVPTQGYLSDHYNPATKELALSTDVYYGRSVATVGIAAHEAGHAMQHAHSYTPLWLRSALVPTANLGSSAGYLVMMAGLFLGAPWLMLAGIALFSMVLLFQVVTLPVEFDATARAKQMVIEAGIVQPYERQGIDAVLDAAALTYVAAVVSTLLVILYYLFRSGVLGRGRS